MRAAAGLAVRLSKIVAGRLGAAAPADRPLSLGEAQALASRNGRLVFLVPVIENGELRVTADAYSVPKSFWDRVRDPSPAPNAHGFAARRIDAEIASFFEAVPLVSERVDKAKQSGDRAVALACGDADGDGSLDLVVVGRSRLQTGRVRRARVVARSEARWNDLVSVAPSPLKQPIAAAQLTGSGRIAVGITDRANAFDLTATLGDPAALEGVVPWSPLGCLQRAGTALGDVRACRKGEPALTWARPSSGVDAIAAARVVDRSGTPREVVAWRRQKDARVVVVDDRKRRVELESAGAQIALGDVDLDGQVDVVTSSDTLDPSGDALVVVTWLDDGSLRERYRLAVPAGIEALAICPPEAGARAAIVAATHDELWVVR
jgi:hypothetical protein